MKVHTIFTTIIIGASLMSANVSAESLCSSDKKDENQTTVQSENENEKVKKRIPVISQLEVHEHNR